MDAAPHFLPVGESPPLLAVSVGDDLVTLPAMPAEFVVVVLPDTDIPRLERLSSVPLLMAFVSDQLRAGHEVHVIEGRQWPLWKHPSTGHVYLEDARGIRLSVGPTFDESDLRPLDFSPVGRT